MSTVFDRELAVRLFCKGELPLSGTLEPWMSEIIVSGKLPRLIQKYGSPLNLICTHPMQRNIDELTSVASAAGCDFGIFFARKSNKCLSFVEQAIKSGIGVDTASENEVSQSLGAGMKADRMICTAAVKSESLVDRCIAGGVAIAIDNQDEMQLVAERAKTMGSSAAVALRLGGFHHDGQKLPTRFGFDVDRDAGLVGQLHGLPLDVQGIHFHLDGYDAGQRVSGICQSISWVDQLRKHGHSPTFIDMGGGFPISYLNDAAQWDDFWSELKQAILGERDPITYRNHTLGLACVDGQFHGSPNSYPYFQEPTGGDWLSSILDADCCESTIAKELSKHRLQLRCEPGRYLMNGCGITVARVEFRKRNADGDWLVGLSMNRTQCRTSSDDFLVDPIVLAQKPNLGDSKSGFLVGAYCTESELLSLRRLHFPSGIQRGDLVVFPNTAGYLMHFLESRSHQFPLARNVVVDGESGAMQPDAIDQASNRHFNNSLKPSCEIDMSNEKPKPTTTDAGIPVASDEHSLTVGADGPILLHDHYLIEQMANFNRERIAERQPHAKGSGAFGHFQVTGDVSEFTKAAVFQPGTKTNTLMRFSTVAGERGSPDTWRDPRGFSIKFYTSEGNYDMVGNNTPVFFIRDPMKFQHFIRSQKRRADNGLRDHDMQWDFWTLSPESAHQVTWLMGDRGIPKTWRHMNGYSSHTYMWVNAGGERYWVKYHFKTDQGIDFLTQDEAVRIAGEDADYHRRDLFNSIKGGEHPSWTMHVQVMPFEEAKTYRFNPFDLTKVWPHGDYPLQEVGKLVLDRNPTDFHTEIEQAAFEPNNLVQGIGASPDKMLLGRLFAYSDAHRARMGVNYKQIPVNRPQCPFHSYSKDGAMRVENVTDPVYAPNSKGGPAADGERFPESATWSADGEFVRAAYTLREDDDDWGQAGTLVRDVMDDAARDRLVSNASGHLKADVSQPVLDRALEYWRNIDKNIGDRIAKAVNG